MPAARVRGRAEDAEIPVAPGGLLGGGLMAVGRLSGVAARPLMQRGGRFIGRFLPGAAAGASGAVVVDQLLDDDGDRVVLQPDQPPTNPSGVAGEFIESALGNPIITAALVVCIGGLAREVGHVLRVARTSPQGDVVPGLGEGFIQISDVLYTAAPLLAGGSIAVDLARALKGTPSP